MKFILATQGIKREIDGPFEMCGSRADIERLRNILDHALKEERYFSYGWLRVDDLIDSPSNTPPRAWKD